MKYIYHHLGLGDHIICNGLVRSLITPDEEYMMFVKSHNYETVKFMYRDLTNLNFIIGEDDYVINFIRNNNISSDNVIVAGFYNHPQSNYFDESFYLQNNVPFINRWGMFRVDRNLESEIKIFNQFGVKENEYVFVHDDASRGFEINDTLIVNKNLPIIRPKHGLTSNVFDYCYLMQNSLESHFIDSSFRLIFDSLKLRETEIYYHLKLKSSIYRNGGKNKREDARNSILNFKIIE